MSSISHSTDPPLSSLTSRKMNACGFVHSKRFTEPLTVTGFAMSYMAVEWWAIARVVAHASPRPVVSSARRVNIHSLRRSRVAGRAVYRIGPRRPTSLRQGFGWSAEASAKAEACALRDPQRAGGCRVDDRGGDERRRESPVHRDEDGERCADH